MASWWIDPVPPRNGFTQFASAQLNAPVRLDDVSDREMQAMQRRADVLATVIGWRAATANRATRAIELSRN